MKNRVIFRAYKKHAGAFSGTTGSKWRTLSASVKRGFCSTSCSDSSEVFVSYGCFELSNLAKVYSNALPLPLLANVRKEAQLLNTISLPKEDSDFQIRKTYWVPFTETKRWPPNCAIVEAACMLGDIVFDLVRQSLPPPEDGKEDSRGMEIWVQSRAVLNPQPFHFGA
jgi:hypothetical protein